MSLIGHLVSSDIYVPFTTMLKAYPIQNQVAQLKYSFFMDKMGVNNFGQPR